MVRTYSIFFMILLYLPQLAFSATFNATVDRTELAQDEQVELTLSLVNSEKRLRAEGVNPNIDLSVLSTNFDVGIPKTNFRYNIYKGKGRSSSELTVKLTPKKNGQLSIPSFNIDNQQTTKITIKVLTTNAHNSPEVFVRSGSNLDDVWRGQQLVVYLDVFHRVALKDTALKNTLETEPLQIELVPHWQLPQSSRSVEHKGINYTVQRIAWALFPSTVGTFKVHLPGVGVQTASATEKHFPSPSLSFNIKALPDNMPSNIIIGQPQVTQTQLPKTIKQHQLQHWTVTIEAPIAVSSLPNYLPYDTAIEQIKFYPDRVRRNNKKTSDGITDQGEYTLSIMPQEAGEYAIPPIQIPYFDPNEGKAKLIELKSQNIQVSPNISGAEYVQTNTDEIFLPEKAIKKESSHWKITAFTFALLWLVSIIFLLKIYKKNKLQANQKQEPTPPNLAKKLSTNPLQQELLKALNTTTLEDGLKQCQKRFPQQTNMLETIKQLQRKIYGHPDGEQKNYDKNVHSLIKEIKENTSH